jgi:diadenosine tetraphosphate (Ap4A) HIT family hydrolase
VAPSGEAAELTAELDAIVARVVGAVAKQPSVWIFGQGSVLTGLARCSDLDIVAVWQTGIPEATLLPGAGRHNLGNGLAFEKHTDGPSGVEVDLMHVSQERMDSWVEAIEAGTDWNSNEWPDPLFAVSGVAHAVILHDPDTTGRASRERLSRPSKAFLDTVSDTFAGLAPMYLREIDRAAARGHWWLQHKLVTKLMRVTYVAIFAAHGHYAPFPKYIPVWFDRIDVPTELRANEAAVWASVGQAQTRALQTLVDQVLTAPSQRTLIGHDSAHAGNVVAPTCLNGQALIMSVDEADCVFCAILAGRLESSRVYEDERVLVFMDIQPVTPGHLLVIPKEHVPYLDGLDEQLGADVFRVAHRLARALRRTNLRCEGVNLFLADGEAAFQEVFHVHLHVFPRYAGDPFRIEATWQTRDRAELDRAAAQVRQGLTALATG